MYAPRIVLLSLAPLLFGCGATPSAPAAPAPSTTASAATPSPSSAPSAAPAAPPVAAVDASWITAGPAFDATSPFADSHLDAIAKKLEGAWFVKLGNGRAQEAWEIKGNTALVANKRGTTAYELKVTSPCTLEMKEKDGSSTESHFVFDGDTFYQGLGDFGLKAKDGTVVACVSNGIYRLKAGKCSKHSRLGTWSEKPAKCVLTKEGFEVSGDTGGKLTFQGAILLSDDPALMKAEKVADLAAGKAKLESK